jgi:hypothetical protein
MFRHRTVNGPAGQDRTNRLPLQPEANRRDLG